MNDFKLDFNNKLSFTLRDVANYDVDTIYDNIDKFKKFMYDSVMFDCFDKVFKTQIFQLSLLDTMTSNIENLLAVYNAVADSDLLGGEKLPEIAEKDLILQLKIRGFKIRSTTQKDFAGNYKRVKKVEKEDRFIWN